MGVQNRRVPLYSQYLNLTSTVLPFITHSFPAVMELHVHKAEIAPTCALTWLKNARAAGNGERHIKNTNTRTTTPMVNCMALNNTRQPLHHWMLTGLENSQFVASHSSLSVWGGRPDNLWSWPATAGYIFSESVSRNILLSLWILLVDFLCVCVCCVRQVNQRKASHTLQWMLLHLSVVCSSLSGGVCQCVVSICLSYTSPIQNRILPSTGMWNGCNDWIGRRGWYTIIHSLQVLLKKTLLRMA